MSKEEYPESISDKDLEDYRFKINPSFEVNLMSAIEFKLLDEEKGKLENSTLEE